MMTADERLVLQTTIVLHGFELYERWLPDSGYWLPILIGRQLPDDEHECVPVMKGGNPTTTRIRMKLATRCQPMYWFQLFDYQLQEFHNTVVTTC